MADTDFYNRLKRRFEFHNALAELVQARLETSTYFRGASAVLFRTLSMTATTGRSRDHEAREKVEDDAARMACAAFVAFSPRDVALLSLSEKAAFERTATRPIMEDMEIKYARLRNSPFSSDDMYANLMYDLTTYRPPAPMRGPVFSEDFTLAPRRFQTLPLEARAIQVIIMSNPDAYIQPGEMPEATLADLLLLVSPNGRFAGIAWEDFGQLLPHGDYDFEHHRRADPTQAGTTPLQYFLKTYVFRIVRNTLSSHERPISPKKEYALLVRELALALAGGLVAQNEQRIRTALEGDVLSVSYKNASQPMHRAAARYCSHEL